MDGDTHIRSLYAHDPLNIHTHIDTTQRSSATVTSLLREYNAPFGISPETASNIDQLANSTTKCLVTGQQLTVFGGPLYTFFKIATTIAQSKRVSNESGRPVIPVFWLADEDHDYEEVASVQLIKGNEIIKHTLADVVNMPIPVANRHIGSNIAAFTDEVFASLGNTDFTEELRQLINACYIEGVSHSKAFGSLIAKIFGKYGLVLAGSNHPDIKASLYPVMIRAIEHAGHVYDALSKQSILADNVSPRQAQISDSLLFYLNPDTGGTRDRIRHEFGVWTAGESQRWTTAELIDDITRHPVYFSPNIFLRPIMQDLLLPTLAYVAGPGELAYYAQMKQLYGVFNINMPVITARHSATLIEPAVRRLMRDLPFEFLHYVSNLYELEREYIEKSTGIHPNQLTDEWLLELTMVSKKYIDAIGDEDITLRASADKVLSEFESSIERVRGKLIRSVKQKEQTDLNRIRRVKTSLFPDNGLQERTLCGIYFMNKYGLDFWDGIIEAFGTLNTDTHYTIDV